MPFEKKKREIVVEKDAGGIKDLKEKQYADGGEVKSDESGIIASLRDYVLGHKGLGGTDDKEYDVAMNVEPSSGTAKGYATGGIVSPDDDMGDLPMPTEIVSRGTPSMPPPPPPPVASPAQGILSQSQGLGAQMAGQYTPQMRNQLYSAMLERQNSTPNAVAGGLASLGDAIARGYGHSQSDFLNQTQQNARGSVDQGLGAFDTAQKANMAQTQAGMELGKMDPTSAVSKLYQDSYSGPLKKLGYTDAQIAKMSASNIEPVAQVGLKYGDIQAQKELKEATLQLTAKMNEAQMQNMKAQQGAKQQEIANQTQTRKEEGAKAILGAGSPWNPLSPVTFAQRKQALADLASGTPPVAGQMHAGGAGGMSAPGMPGMAAASGPVKVNSAAEYTALPSGTHYVDSFGTEKVKK